MVIKALMTVIGILILFIGSTIVQAKDAIRLTSGEWPPYLSEHLPHDGFASHIVTLAFEQVGVDVAYGYYPWSRSYSYAKQGIDIHGQKWHGTLVWVKTDERLRDFYFSDPVIFDDEVLFFHKEKNISWKNVEDLQGLTIAATRHTAYPMLEEAAKRGIITIERAGNYNVLLKRVFHYKTIDAAPLLKQVGFYYLDTTFSHDDAKKMTFSPNVIEPREYHLILSKKVRGNKELIDRFNKGLKQLRNSGVFQALYQELQEGKYNQQTNLN